MKQIVFATNNLHKLEEVRHILRGKAEIHGLSDIGCFDDIPETAETLEGNAELKARYVAEKFSVDCFADDTGLEIEALNGKPGVYSARYAGEPSNSRENVKKVLSELEGEINRKARFRTIIALIEKGELHTFEGIINGKIAYYTAGDNGFGYDPIFIPDGYDKSFAELNADEKNKISHRALAVKNLSEYFQKINSI